MKKIFFLSLGSISLLLFVNIQVSACTCNSNYIGQTLEQQVKRGYQQSDAAFVGQVLRIETNARNFRTTVKIRVKEYWKGNLSSVVTVSSSKLTSMCGYPFRTGKSYLVFARNLGKYYSKKIYLSTGFCSGNQPFELIGEQVKILGQGKKPPKGKT